MNKEEFLEMFAECIKSGEIEISTSIEYSECFGHETVTNIS